MNNVNWKKVGRFLSNLALSVFLLICVLAVVLTFVSRKGSDGTAEIFGYQMRLVTSDSMAKCEHTDVSPYEIKSIPVRSMIFVKVMPVDPEEADAWYRNLKVGDVLTFRYVYSTQVTITHRIISITEKESGGFVIQLAGDNKSSENGQLYQTIDTSIPNNTNYVIGKVTGQCYLFGFIMSFLTSPLGIVLAIILPCVIIIFFEILKIIKTFNADKKAQQEEELLKKEIELEDLRSRLAEFEENSKAGVALPDETEETLNNDCEGKETEG